MAGTDGFEPPTEYSLRAELLRERAGANGRIQPGLRDWFVVSSGPEPFELAALDRVTRRARGLDLPKLD